MYGFVETKVLSSREVCRSFAALDAVVFDVTNETYVDIARFSAGSFMHLTRNKISRSSNQYVSGRSGREINLAYIIE